MTNLHPEIDFQHVLKELSVNRNDPCEVVRELISNSYDAKATEIRLGVISSKKGICFFDNGSGLDRLVKTNGITPYEAFFSIGKSTKVKGDGGVGYKCQGSKLCFAASRVLIITRTNGEPNWSFKVVENPRNTLSPAFDITPEVTTTPDIVLADFFSGADAQGKKVVESFDSKFFQEAASGTLVAVMDLDAEGFNRYFVLGAAPEKSYLYNYIRHYTRHGDTSYISKVEGFTASDVKQVSSARKGLTLPLWSNDSFVDVQEKGGWS